MIEQLNRLGVAIGLVLILSSTAWSFGFLEISKSPGSFNSSDPFDQCAVKKVEASRALFQCLVEAHTKIFSKNLDSRKAERLKKRCLRKHTRQLSRAVKQGARKGVECSTMDQEELIDAIEAQAQELVNKAVTPNEVDSEQEGEFIGGQFGAMPEACECVRENGIVGSCGRLTAAVRCVYGRQEGSQLGLNLEALRRSLNEVLAERPSGLEIGLLSPVVMEAWGGGGGRGANDYVIFKTCDGGGGGRGGYARTTRTYEDVLNEGTDGLLYLYVGREGPQSNERGGRGGSSSILMGKPITDSGNGNFPGQNVVQVIGGGGAGGSGCAGINQGNGGGAGGCAIARSSFIITSCALGVNSGFASGPGADGGGGGAGGEGGNRNGNGFGGGPPARAGERGIGGFGGRNQNDNGWIGWEGSDLTHADWSPGSGGLGIKLDGRKDAGGGGGGGFGGGGGGSQGGGGGGGGGGGAGSWAKGATADESGLPFLGQDGHSPRSGAVALTFGVEPTGSSAPAQP